MIRIALTNIPETDHALEWSRWRRQHQHHAKQCHYNSRGHDPPKSCTPTVGLRVSFVLAKDHATSTRLQHAGDGDPNVCIDMVATAFDHDHCAIV